MLIRRVTAPTRQEAFEKLRKELGPDVEIVHAASHRRRGFLGFFFRIFRQEWIEVVGVRPDRSTGEVESHQQPIIQAVRDLANSGLAEISQQPALELAAPLALPPSPDSAPAPAAEALAAATALPQLAELSGQIHEMRQQLNLLSDLKDIVNRFAASAPAAAFAGPCVSAGAPPVGALPGSTDEADECDLDEPDSRSATSLAATGQQVPDCRPLLGSALLVPRGETVVGELQYVDAAMQALRAAEMSEELLAEMRRYLLEVLGPRELLQPALIRERAIDYLMARLPVARGIELVKGEKGKLVALVGPTGVGKTTTLAKLAGGLAFNQKLDVAFITIDTYRIAAPEQLRKYAEIVEVPVKVVFQPEEMIELVRSFKNKDIILIDTVGRSPRNREDILDLRKFLEFGMPIETHLLVSSTTKLSDLRSILSGFQDLQYSKVIVTKTDETATFGPILSALAEQKAGISYLTTGQTVPDDILTADAAQLAALPFSRRGLVPAPARLPQELSSASIAAD
jgi:flagellar biosynthesis GTPase FlhF